uniref:Uncharacterized protein n=1 Tax=Anopheles minimus TaxID=112268 RepID=A0A182WP14_9DIPT
MSPCVNFRLANLLSHKS